MGILPQLPQIRHIQASNTCSWWRGGDLRAPTSSTVPLLLQHCLVTASKDLFQKTKLSNLGYDHLCMKADYETSPISPIVDPLHSETLHLHPLILTICFLASTSFDFCLFSYSLCMHCQPDSRLSMFVFKTWYKSSSLLTCESGIFW